MVSGLSIYGGFAGGETDLAQRDVATNVTVMTGDLNGDDGVSFVNIEDNSLHVVTASNPLSCELPDKTCIDGLTEDQCSAIGGMEFADSTCAGPTSPRTLDGFTIRGANADDPDDINDRRGGGLFNGGEDLTVANCTFDSNWATDRGGGMLDAGANTIVTGCTFIGNASIGTGGAYVAQSVMASLSQCVFETNDLHGVLVWNGADPVFVDCDFITNVGSGIQIESSGNSTVTLTDCDFIGNDLGMDIEFENTVVATGCTISSHTSAGIASAGFLTLDNCMLIGNSPVAVTASGPTGVTTIIATDSVFMDNGGAIQLGNGHAILTNCMFDGNGALVFGGALHLSGDNSSVTLDGGSFIGNTAPDGSAIYVNSFARLEGTTTLLGADELFNAGTLRPGGDGFGEVMIDGAYRQAELGDPGTFASVLELDVGGTVAGTEYDVVDVSGGAAIIDGGALILRLVDFEPSLGQTFDIIPAAFVSGSFDVASMPGLPAGLFLSVQSDAGGISVSVEMLDTLLVLDSPTFFNLPSEPSDIAVADMDNDTDLDIVLAVPDADNPGNPGEVIIFKNLGIGTNAWLGFDPTPVVIAVGADPRAVTVGRFDGDAFMDVATANNADGTVSILLNNGTGDAMLSLDANVVVALFPVDVAAASTPGDDAVDLAVASIDFARVTHLVNDGAGSFSVGQTFTGSPFPSAVALEDMDDDGDPDLVVVRRDLLDEMVPSTVGVRLFDDQTGMFGDADVRSAGLGSSDVGIADLDLDDQLDAVTADETQGTLSVLTNRADGTGGLNPASLVPIGTSPRALTVTDLDLDGDRDLLTIVTNDLDEPTVRFIRNDIETNGPLTLATAVDLGTGGDPLLVVAGDLDGDALDDVIVVNSADPAFAGPPSASLAVLLNLTETVVCPADCGDGDGLVTVVDLLAMLADWGGPGACDTDGSGTVDIVDLLELLASWGDCS